MIYYVDETGEYLKKDCCSYHWGKLHDRRYNEEQYWTCCNKLKLSLGCTKANGHVWNGFTKPGINGPFAGYVYTESSKDKQNHTVYALDCEMCYTRHGFELIKVTVVNLCGKIVYNKFVKPSSEIIDYNTRFSGITEQDLLDVTTTFEDVQKELKTIIYAETIIFGHNLGSDFRMLRLFHDKIIDTSVLFPHSKPFPYCHSLKWLAKWKLNRIIQETHDSFEDACAVKDLVLLYVQENKITYDVVYKQPGECWNIGMENTLFNT
ncbi:putative exonuclease GOR [Nylanderia fulva]|uniref:putative exonuclease GOR n=1 Tax=Nylanderia fulva TaxID=613905 RepID=UPI0010FB27A5|nr:putative exonuclease GOR [Nylanderia fulva]